MTGHQLDDVQTTSDATLVGDTPSPCFHNQPFENRCIVNQSNPQGAAESRVGDLDDTLEQLSHRQALNSLLQTALARGARLLTRADPDKADLFRKGIGILRRESKAQGFRIMAAFLALNFIFGAVIPMIASGSGETARTESPPSILTLPGYIASDFQVGIKSANLTVTTASKIITVKTEEYVIKVDYTTSFVDYTIRPYFCSDFIRYRRVNPQYAGDGTVDSANNALDSVAMTISRWGRTDNVVWFLESCNEFSMNQTFRIYRDYFELEAKYAPGTKKVMTSYFIGLYSGSNSLINLISGGNAYRYVPGIAEDTPAGYGLGGWYPSFKMFAPACDMRAPGKSLGVEWGYDETVAYIGSPVWLKDMGGGGDSVFALKFSSMNSVVPNINLGGEKTFHMFVRPYQYSDGKVRGHDVGYAQWVTPRIAATWGVHNTPIFPLTVMNTGTWTSTFRSWVENSQVKLASYSGNPDQIDWNYKSAQIAGLENANPADVPSSWQVFTSSLVPLVTSQGRAVCNPVSGPYTQQGTFRWQLIMNDDHQDWWTSTDAVFWDEINNWDANNHLRNDYQNRLDFVYTGYLELARDSYQSGYWEYLITNSFTGLLHLAMASDITLIEGYEPSSIFGENMIKHVQSTMNFVNNIPSELRPRILVYQNYATSSSSDQQDVYSVLFGSANYGFDVELLSYDSYTSQMHNLIMAEEMFKAMGCTRDSDIRIPVATLDLLSASTTTTSAQMVVTRGAGTPIVTFSAGYDKYIMTNLWSTSNSFEFVIPSTSYYLPGSGLSQVGGVSYSSDGKAHFFGSIAAEKTGTVMARSDLAISQLASGTATITLISKDSAGASLRASATGGTTQITFKGMAASTMFDLKINSVKVDSRLSDAQGNVVFSRSFGSNDLAEVLIGQADTQPPQVLQTMPARGATYIPIGNNVEIVFNEAMNKASVQGAFSLNAASKVQGTYTWFDGDRRLVFDPSSDLAYSTSYSVSLTVAALDTSGNPLASAWSSSFVTADYVPILTAPPAPVAVSASGGFGNVTVTWSPPQDDGGSPITGYLVYRSQAQGQEGITPYVTLGTNLRFIDAGLPNGASYYYTVSARNAIGTGAQSSEVHASSYNVPGIPGSVMATAGANTITLSWSTPSNDGGSAITSYRIYGSSSPGAEQFLSETTSTRFVESGLADGAVRYYRISASNLVGEGQKCGELTATTYSFAPSSPEPLTAISMDGAVILSWTSPSSDGGSPITGYSIMRGEMAGGEIFLASVQDTLTYHDDVVQNGVTYYYRVTATNAVGTGPASNEVSAMPKGKPSAPINLSAEVRVGSVVLSWQEPTNNGGSAIASYNVYRGTTPEQLTFLANVSSLAFTDQTVNQGAFYLYSVSAVNSVGEGSPSDEVAVVADFVPTVPLNLTIRLSDAIVILDWDAPSNDYGYPVECYRVYRAVDQLSFVQIAETGDDSYNDSALSYGHIYDYRVTAVNSAGEGLPSSVVSATPITIPGQPSNLMTVGGYRNISLNWQAPIFDGGSLITSYRIYRASSVRESMQQIAIVEGSISYVDSGLIDDAPYWYAVSACNSVGEGALSIPSNGTTFGLPAPPSNLIASISANIVTLTWDVPVDDGGSPISSYRIYRGISTGPSQLIAVSRVTEWQDEHAEYGLQYGYSIMAVNCVGEGPAVSIAATIPGIPPNAPTSLRASVSDGHIVLVWAAPMPNGAGEPIGYEIYRGTSSGSEAYYSNVDTNDTRFEDANVSIGVTYHYRVAAQNRFGTGEQSSGTSGTIPSSLPDAPTKLTAKIVRRGIQLKWNVADGHESAIKYYNIYRGVAAGQEVIIGSVTSGLTYLDAYPGAIGGYHYRVSAVSFVGEGALSNSASVNADKQSNIALYDQHAMYLGYLSADSGATISIPVHQASDNAVIIQNATMARVQAGMQGPIVAGTGAAVFVAMFAVVLIFSRSGLAKKKGDMMTDLSKNETLPAEKPIVEQSSAEHETPAHAKPTMKQEEAIPEPKRNAIDVEFENALEELASMARY